MLRRDYFVLGMLQLVHTPSLADEREAALKRSNSIMAGHIAIARHADSERRLALALDAGQMGTWDLDLSRDTSVRSLRHYPTPHYKTCGVPRTFSRASCPITRPRLTRLLRMR